eukprot:Gregarina_sp_Poly_1__1845@NODE_147_length_12810_cov_168_129012_g132_i0_p4_GENE_NODE_147_length_12810_cov_168_129012_g132_i0NODE_147_length_12810_cov_168_129012_g132_i0_p4_ORF_typecomplete_len390_score42_51Methyltr_RsmBF/PF01189_17/2_5e39Methyltransf_31/PF13847_6/2_5e03Methyltransf_31/PF13847_6/3_9e13Methyltransf_23/PF13489_6/8_3e08Ubie_methyltran/PF01209_18/4_3e07Ubie_methyltran/PF01209_18/1_2e02Methyltransf_25/PF13649_6/8_6e07Methyltransf_25/PF13649_6/1_7e03Methyltransf_11/PF08241_12/2_6e06Meth
MCFFFRVNIPRGFFLQGFVCMSLRSSFPGAFESFLLSRGIGPETIASLGKTSAFRYVRLNPRSKPSSLDASVFEPVRWLPEGFGAFQLDERWRLSEFQEYKNAEIYGVDAASLAAVWALQVPSVSTSPTNVLDLCCAPGNKAFAFADVYNANVFGVDVSVARLEIARKRMKQYSVPNCVLLKGDGTVFDPMCPATYTHYDHNELKSRRRQRKKEGISIPKYPLPELFDRVLVDAECTHDGSTRHLQKYVNGQFDQTLEVRVLNQGRLKGLAPLQLGLLRNGYRLLRPGGLIVYSTCSLCPTQNQNVIESFLEGSKRFEMQPQLMPLPFRLRFCSECVEHNSALLPPAEPVEIKALESTLTHFHAACLFHPKYQVTSGLFLCLLGKPKKI